MSDRAPPRDPSDVDAWVRRLDHRRALASTAAAILGLGTAAFYVGVPLVWGEHVPLAVCVIPPSIFAALVTVLTVGNARQVRLARRLVVEGEVVEPEAWAWIVFAFAAPGDPRDPRGWSLPAEAAGVAQGIDLDLLDTYRDWMPRQNRTVSVELADGTRLIVRDVPAHVGAGDLRSATVLRLDTGGGRIHGLVVRHLGLLPVWA